MPLGWIAFDEVGAPARDIYVSHANALALLTMMRDATPPTRMPRAELETMLGRAMGRALAHELGHFLLATKTHSANGLMRARRTSAEFFSAERARFAVDAEQRALILSRYQPVGSLVAAATTSPAVPGEPGALAGWMLDDPARSRKFERD